MIRFLAIASAAIVAAGLWACTAEEPEPTPEMKQAAAGPPPVGVDPGSAEDPHRGIPNHPAVSPIRNEGKVVSKIDAGRYQYIQVESGGGKIWLATDRADVEVGGQARWGQGALMRNFESKTLGRTFDEVYFVNAVLEDEAGARGPSNIGIVESKQDAGGYTYIEVDQDGQLAWLAVPQTRVSVGDRVEWSGGSVMTNFTSNSLGRTFDQIIFAGGVRTAH